MYIGQKENKKLESLILVVSDFHIGQGHEFGKPNKYDEFFFDEDFAEFLEYYSTGTFSNINVELVINGDFFDLLKVRYNNKFPDVITEIVAISKLKDCIKGHPIVIEALKKFLSYKKNKITYIPGNHDMEFFFDSVQEVFRQTLTDNESRDRINFITDTTIYKLKGNVQIHHGFQFELPNIINLKTLILTKNLPQPVLNLPWGSYFVLNVINPLKAERPYIDQIRPFSRFLLGSLILDVSFTLRLIFKTIYYFCRVRFFKHPARNSKFSRTFKLITKGLTFYPTLDEHAKKILHNNANIQVVIFGHSHIFRIRSFDNNKLYINTGTWTKIMNLDLFEFAQNVKKTYAQIEYYKNEDKPSAFLLEWKGMTKQFKMLNF
ncbi:MAG: metallophosphoesterase [Pseudomonadota bacterium]